MRHNISRSLPILGSILGLSLPTPGWTQAPPPAASAPSATAPPAPNYDVPIHGHGKFVTTKQGRIYYETEGSGPAVFLVAGGPGGSHASFHPWFSRLATDHTVVYFDNIGRGRSSRLKDPKGYAVPRDAEDIEAIRKALKFDRISVIGHSYGGMPAMAYALKYPQHTAHLVLSDTLYNAKSFQDNIDTSNAVLAHQYPEVWARLLQMRRKGMLSSAEAYQDLQYAGADMLYWCNTANGAKLFRSGDPADRMNFGVYLAMLGMDPEWVVGGTMKGYNPVPRIRKMRVPTLICVGRYDRVASPKIASEMKALIPRARLVIFEQSGHRPWVEETDRYFTIVHDFLNR